MSGFSISDLGFSQYADEVRRQGDERGAGITRAQVEEIAKTFEQMLMNVMVEEMRETVPESGLLPEAPGHDLYEQMMYQEFVRSAGDRGVDLGIREALERHFEAFLVDDPPAVNPSSEAGSEGVSTEENTLNERRTAGS